jgi:hypothetical protein
VFWCDAAEKAAEGPLDRPLMLIGSLAGAAADSHPCASQLYCLSI